MLGFGQCGALQRRQLFVEQPLPFDPERVRSCRTGLNSPAIQGVLRVNAQGWLATQRSNGLPMQGQGKLIQLLLSVHGVDY